MFSECVLIFNFFFFFFQYLYTLIAVHVCVCLYRNTKLLSESPIYVNINTTGSAKFKKIISEKSKYFPLFAGNRVNKDFLM